MPLLLVNRVNIYKALYYLTSGITSLTVSSSTLPFSCFLLHWPSFCSPLTDQVFSHYGLFPQRATRRCGVYSRVSSSGGFLVAHSQLVLTILLSCMIYLTSCSCFLCILLVFVCLYMEYIKLMMEGFLLFMFTTKRLYPVLRAFCNNW